MSLHILIVYSHISPFVELFLFCPILYKLYCKNKWLTLYLFTMSTPLKFKTLPNAITALRIVAIPLVLYCIYTGATQGSSFWMTLALVGLIFGEITDYADGSLARKNRRSVQCWKTYRSNE